MPHLKHPGLSMVLSLCGLCALSLPSAVEAQDPPLTQYRATVLVKNLKDPTGLAFLPDGRVYFTLKAGTVRLLNPSIGAVSTAATLPAANLREDGLHSIVLDPNFATNRWVYVLFSERTSTDTSVVVARYQATASFDSLIVSTRATLLRVPYTLNNSTAEHNTGSLAFGPDGNLFIGLADNTQNLFGSVKGAGYAPRDPARPLYDAQRSAANTNDLRGKILRIHPEANGTYSIPAGNLKDSINRPSFNPNWSASEDSLTKVRPEIYVMGLRHPFRISVDAQTGWLFWAEPGPNAVYDSVNQGPRGYDVFSMAKGPGNYGWPYCRANPSTIQKPSSVTTPYCYTAYNYTTGIGGAMYNPNLLRNTSINNTGIVNLPPMKPASAWYPFNATGTAFPIFGICSNNNCNTSMIGPVYNYNASQSSSRLPSNFDRHVFLLEWARDLILVARVDSAGGLQNLRTFRNARDSVTNGPMDVKIGPDGALYFLNWANSGAAGNYNYPTNSGGGSLTRFEFTGTHTAVAMGKGRDGASLRNHLFASVSGRVYSLPAGAVGADFFALNGARLWTFHREDASTRLDLTLPAQVHGVVRVRLLENR